MQTHMKTLFYQDINLWQHGQYMTMAAEQY